MTPPEAPKKVGDLEAQQELVRTALLTGLAPDAHDPTHADHARWLLAHLVGWHRREDKAHYWERYRLNDLTEEELLDERQAFAGLEFVERVRVVLHKTTRKPTGTVVDRYRYPAQDVEIRRGKLLMAGPSAWGEIDTHDLALRALDVSKGKKTADVHPRRCSRRTSSRPTRCRSRCCGWARPAGSLGRWTARARSP